MKEELCNQSISFAWRRNYATNLYLLHFTSSFTWLNMCVLDPKSTTGWQLPEWRTWGGSTLASTGLWRCSHGTRRRARAEPENRGTCDTLQLHTWLAWLMGWRKLHDTGGGYVWADFFLNAFQEGKIARHRRQSLSIS